MKFRLGDKEFRIYGGPLEGFLFHLQIELPAFRKYILDAEDKIKDEELKLQSDIQKKIDEGKDEEYVNYIHELDDRVLFSMSAIHKNSQLLSLYAFLESQMKELCDIVAKDTNQKLRLKDLTGSNYVESGRTYLTKVLDLDISSLNHIWSKVHDYKVLRNCIAHKNSNIRENEGLLEKQPKYQVINRFGLEEIELYEYGVFRFKTSKLLIEFCDLQKELFIELLKLIDDKLYKKK